ncbi:MAG: bifunctional serine/threonine-protein kinase/formylglycine-generating enzyme family protein [Myxococcota bacterium]
MRCPRCGASHAAELSSCPSCGAAAPTYVPDDTPVSPTIAIRAGPPAIAIGEGSLLGPYRLGPRIGEGGMSAVYAATDRLLGRDVAVKVLHPNLVGDDGIRRRFLREGRITSGWAHPNVVPVFDTVSTDGAVALVQERVHGPTLARLLEQWRGGMPPRELGEIAVGLLAGLEAAHARGIVHRDLKPGNVLVDVVGGRLVPRIIDFGIARVLEGTTYTLTGAVLGTCRYMSPEQVRGEPVDHRSDLYAFGVVLYELATGQPVFPDAQPFALMMAHTNKVPTRPSTIRPDLHPAIERAIVACLAKYPEERPTAAGALRRELMTALAIGEPPAVPRTGSVGNGHELLRVDAGPFGMGHDRREVWLDAFAIDRLPVTNAQYHAFLRATGYRPDDRTRFLSHWPSSSGPAPEQHDHPVVFVSQLDATAYAGWLGLRLPTDAEWEKAARGTDGRRYPWGAAPPSLDRVWFGQRKGTAPVGGRPAGASPYGVEDLVGLVWEWCSDEDDPAFHREGPPVNPRRPARPDSALAVVRGGAWMFDDPKAVRTTTRTAVAPGERLDTVGFRCAS